MARENKRNRDAKLFGRPERLADILVHSPPDSWNLNPFLHLAAQKGILKREDFLQTIAKIQTEIVQATVIVADNVNRFYYDHDKCEWDFKTDIPNCAPPMDRFLIELRTPPTIRVEDGIERTTEGMPEISGGLFYAIEASTTGNVFLAPETESGGPMSPVHLPDAKWFIQCAMLMVQDGKPLATGTVKFFAVNESGRIISGPYTIMGGSTDGFQHTPNDIASTYDLILIPALLALSFMHCSNVTVQPHDPDPIINRLRKKNGKKPFIRYHTINIEPMRKVLRDEGGADTHGLKKALHICRGHFATYTTSFLGRTLDKPLTIWKPAHVRGSAKEGIVLSDYNVNPGDN